MGTATFGGNYLGANYVGSTIVGNGITCGGVYGCPGGPYYGGLYNGYTGYNGYYGYLNNNVFPAGGTAVGGVVYYNDNRFCGDGKVAFVPGRGYYCQNGGPLVTNGVEHGQLRQLLRQRLRHLARLRGGRARRPRRRRRSRSR